MHGTQANRAEAPLAAPEDGSAEMFKVALAPYGNWLDVERYGRCCHVPEQGVNAGLPPRQVERVYASSTVGTRIRGDGRTIINNGLPASRVAAATYVPIHTVALREATAPVQMGGRAERFEASGQGLTIYRPNPTLAS